MVPVRKRNGVNELWYTFPYWYIRQKNDEKEKEKTRKKERKREDTENNENKIKKKRSKHALRAQAESLGDKIAVCWYDPCCDVSS